MIEQGTDSLSCSVWISHFHNFATEEQMLVSIFDPVTFHPSILQIIKEHISDIHISLDWEYYDWAQSWREIHCFDHTTVWCPPLELGFQVITILLNMWI